MACGPIFDDASAALTAEGTLLGGDQVVQRWRYDWDRSHVRGIGALRTRGRKVAEKLPYIKG